MSPAFIVALMHYHFSASPDNGLPDSIVNSEALRFFLTNGCIERTKHFSDGYANYTTTPKGMALVQMICDTPMPTCEWSDPRLRK